MTVEYLDVATKLDIPVDRVLEQAIGHLDYALVLGTHKSGERYIAVSEADVGKALLMLETAKLAILGQVS
ncbi:MAG: hypothetical protein ACE5FM_08375 [Methyloligellaceae bacterium]